MEGSYWLGCKLTCKWPCDDWRERRPNFLLVVTRTYHRSTTSHRPIGLLSRWGDVAMDWGASRGQCRPDGGGGDLQGWTGDRDEVHFEPPKLAVRNLDPRLIAIVDRCSLKIRQQIELRSIIDDSEIQNHEISLVQYFYIGTKFKLDPVSEPGSFDLGSGKMFVQPGIRNECVGSLQDAWSSSQLHEATEATAMVRVSETGLRWLAVILLASHLSEPGSTLGWVTPGFSQVGIVPDDDTDRRVISGISRLPPPLHSDASPFSTHSTFIGSQDLVAGPSGINCPLASPIDAASPHDVESERALDWSSDSNFEDWLSSKRPGFSTDQKRGVNVSETAFRCRAERTPAAHTLTCNIVDRHSFTNLWLGTNLPKCSVARESSSTCNFQSDIRPLSIVEEFAYLKTSLSGEPSPTVQPFIIFGSYLNAVNQYQRKMLIVSLRVEALLTIQWRLSDTVLPKWKNFVKFSGIHCRSQETVSSSRAYTLMKSKIKHTPTTGCQASHNQLAENSMTWYFNPLTVSHFGGNWEAGMKSVKSISSRLSGSVADMWRYENRINSRQPGTSDFLCRNHITPTSTATDTRKTASTTIFNCRVVSCLRCYTGRGYVIPALLFQAQLCNRCDSGITISSTALQSGVEWLGRLLRHRPLRLPCKNPRATRPGIEPGSPWREAVRLKEERPCRMFERKKPSKRNPAQATSPLLFLHDSTPAPCRMPDERTRAEQAGGAQQDGDLANNTAPGSHDHSAVLRTCRQHGLLDTRSYTRLPQPEAVTPRLRPRRATMPRASSSSLPLSARLSTGAQCSSRTAYTYRTFSGDLINLGVGKLLHSLGPVTTKQHMTVVVGKTVTQRQPQVKSTGLWNPEYCRYEPVGIVFVCYPPLACPESSSSAGKSCFNRHSFLVALLETILFWVEGLSKPDRYLKAGLFPSGVSWSCGATSHFQYPLFMSMEKALSELLQRNRVAFIFELNDLGRTNVICHHIDTGNARLIKQPRRRQPLASHEAVEGILKEMKELGVIEPSVSPYRHPLPVSRVPRGHLHSVPSPHDAYLRHLLMMSLLAHVRAGTPDSQACQRLGGYKARRLNFRPNWLWYVLAIGALSLYEVWCFGEGVYIEERCSPSELWHTMRCDVLGKGPLAVGPVHRECNTPSPNLPLDQSAFPIMCPLPTPAHQLYSPELVFVRDDRFLATTICLPSTSSTECIFVHHAGDSPPARHPSAVQILNRPESVDLLAKFPSTPSSHQTFTFACPLTCPEREVSAIDLRTMPGIYTENDTRRQHREQRQASNQERCQKLTTTSTSIPDVHYNARCLLQCQPSTASSRSTIQNLQECVDVFNAMLAYGKAKTLLSLDCSQLWVLPKEFIIAFAVFLPDNLQADEDIVLYLPCEDCPHGMPSFATDGNNQHLWRDCMSCRLKQLIEARIIPDVVMDDSGVDEVDSEATTDLL
ncbi:hypothetical protein PR048_005669 [Dryococelus australis]|uniref:Uncharacterized protein n=1 Tax=Dryococelus australis TaxID=614101 RepID=A0ABQ9I903_9NEOP|nr:hypothetical protein PR048_005669 [Dryococelus australis]